jgi:CRP-like cAMP-binding protein
MRAASVPHTPKQNHILASLPLQDYARLLPELELVALPLGCTVSHAGECEKHLYFLTEGIVSRLYVTADGESAESAITGREGLIGVALVLGGTSMLSQVVVLKAGYAYRLREGQLKNEFKHKGELLPLLLRYTLALLRQTGQIAACNRHHSLKQKLCRCILSNMDHLPSNDLAMTHELIANLLGVRREGVTEAAGMLQAAGLIRCCRGHIAVVDRPLLEAQVCECYALIKREYDSLLPDYRRAQFAH